jgi:hypothetical protein
VSAESRLSRLEAATVRPDLPVLVVKRDHPDGTTDSVAVRLRFAADPPPAPAHLSAKPEANP